MKTVLEITINMFKKVISESGLEYIVVVEDAEQRGFEESLDSLENSIRSIRDINLGISEMRGKYSRFYQIEEPISVKLLLIVQGLDWKPVWLKDRVKYKRALEDYLIYLMNDKTEELYTNYRGLIERILRGKKPHKKLALLTTIYSCDHSIESIIFSIDRGRFLSLVSMSDGLRELISVIGNIIGYNPLR